MGKTVFVTVGTTSFEGLVAAVQTKSVIEELKLLGVQQALVQTGDSAFGEGKRELHGMKFEFFKYRSEILSLIELVDFVISHAGAGSALDVLDRKKPLIVVPNPTLMHNHQDELAEYLDKKLYAVKGTVETLSESIKGFSTRSTSLRNLKPVDKNAFEQFVCNRFQINETQNFVSAIVSTSVLGEGLNMGLLLLILITFLLESYQLMKWHVSI